MGYFLIELFFYAVKTQEKYSVFASNLYQQNNASLKTKNTNFNIKEKFRACNLTYSYLKEKKAKAV